jgi:hypothetical protein
MDVAPLHRPVPVPADRDGPISPFRNLPRFTTSIASLITPPPSVAAHQQPSNGRDTAAPSLTVTPAPALTSAHPPQQSLPASPSASAAATRSFLNFPARPTPLSSSPRFPLPPPAATAVDSAALAEAKAAGQSSLMPGSGPHLSPGSATRVAGWEKGAGAEDSRPEKGSIGADRGGGGAEVQAWVASGGGGAGTLRYERLADGGGKEDEGGSGRRGGLGAMDVREMENWPNRLLESLVIAHEHIHHDGSARELSQPYVHPHHKYPFVSLPLVSAPAELPLLPSPLDQRFPITIFHETFALFSHCHFSRNVFLAYLPSRRASGHSQPLLFQPFPNLPPSSLLPPRPPIPLHAT